MDIEDLGTHPDLFKSERRPNKKPIGYRKKAKNDEEHANQKTMNVLFTEFNSSFHPELADKKIYVKTWGCTHNSSDSEYMAGLLKHAGYELIMDDTKKHDADCWVLNSCTVKGPS